MSLEDSDDAEIIRNLGNMSLADEKVPFGYGEAKAAPRASTVCASCGQVKFETEFSRNQ